MPWPSGYVSSAIAWPLDIFICQVNHSPIDQSKCPEAMMLPPGLLDCSKKEKNPRLLKRGASIKCIVWLVQPEILCTVFDPQKKSKEAKKSKIWFKDFNSHKSWNKQVSKLMSKNQYDWCHVVQVKILRSTNPETPKGRLFISNLFELPFDWLSQ